MDIDNLSLNPSSKNELITILKARFKAIETNTYGLVISFFDDEKREVESLVAIASHYSSLFDIDPHLPWYSFEENLIDIKWKGDVALNITIDLQNYLESSLDKDRGYELLMLIKNNDQTKIESLLQAILMKPLSDRNIIIETVAETITKEAMNNVRSERNKFKTTKSSTNTAESKLKGQNILNVELMLAPVSGIPIYELKKGNKIMIRIANKGTKEKYYIEQFGVNVDDNILPLPAEVIDVSKNENNEYTILVKLEKGIYGKAIETEQVRLKKYDTLISPTVSDESEFKIIGNETKAGTFPSFIMVIGGLMFVVLLIFIIMWFYNII